MGMNLVTTTDVITEKAITVYETHVLLHFLYIDISALITNANTQARMPKNAYCTGGFSSNLSKRKTFYINSMNSDSE